jgi:hypothetical protein
MIIFRVPRVEVPVLRLWLIAGYYLLRGKRFKYPELSGYFIYWRVRCKGFITGTLTSEEDSQHWLCSRRQGSTLKCQSTEAMNNFALSPPAPWPVDLNTAADWPYWVGYFKPRP